MLTHFGPVRLPCLLVLAISLLPCFLSSQPQKLQVGENQRFLVKADGSPFVWIGETNWFFAELLPTTIDSLLDRRQAQGFTVMMISCRQPLYNGKGGPGSPQQPNEAWWAYLDEYLEKCAQRDLYVGITLGWWAVAKRYDAQTLYEYGKWVGNRYRDQDHVIWFTLGEAGSHRRKDTLAADKLAALVKGIREGDTGQKLLTVHADFQRGTSISDDAALCDFNNWQTGQWCCPAELPRKDPRQWTVWEAIAFDYAQRYEGKPKPTLDAEAWYENNKDFCDATPFQIRRRAYFTLFAGAFGHTYGAGGVWDGLNTSRGCSGSALEALDYPGAEQMGYLSQFLQGLGADLLQLRPNQAFILSGNSRDYDTHRQASVAQDRSFALVYTATGQPFSIDLSLLDNRDNLAILWYNPRQHTFGQPLAVPLQAGQTSLSLDPPGEVGPGNDWVLVVGEAAWVEGVMAKAVD